LHGRGRVGAILGDCGKPFKAHHLKVGFAEIP